MSDKIQQSSSGDYSPVVAGDNNRLNFNIENKSRLANEVRTMLLVISQIPEVARKRGVTSSDSPDYFKDFIKKIEIRFAPYKDRLTSRFTELDIQYRGSYDEARRNSEIDEFQFDEMCGYLRNLSLKILSEKANDPIAALDDLVTSFKEQFASSGDRDFSIQAIEYFLHKQLIECNVFPNPEVEKL